MFILRFPSPTVKKLYHVTYDTNYIRTLLLVGSMLFKKFLLYIQQIYIIKEIF